MDLLLDTCAFIWWDSGVGSLSTVAVSALADSANRLHLSHASLWEMQLKHQKGKLLLWKPLADPYLSYPRFTTRRSDRGHPTRQAW